MAHAIRGLSHLAYFVECDVFRVRLCCSVGVRASLLSSVGGPFEIFLERLLCAES